MRARIGQADAGILVEGAQGADGDAGREIERAALIGEGAGASRRSDVERGIDQQRASGQGVDAIAGVADDEILDFRRASRLCKCTVGAGVIANRCGAGEERSSVKIVGTAGVCPPRHTDVQ